MSHPRERTRRARGRKDPGYTLAEAIAAILYGKDWDEQGLVITDQPQSSIRYHDGADAFSIPKIPRGFMEQLRMLIEINEKKGDFKAWRDRTTATETVWPEDAEHWKNVRRSMTARSRRPRTLMDFFLRDLRKKTDKDLYPNKPLDELTPYPYPMIDGGNER